MNRLVLVMLVACGSNKTVTPDAAPPPQDVACVQDPHTHDEIINACTDAEKIEITETPPLLNADGTLPPLPP